MTQEQECRCDCVNCVTGNHAQCYYYPRELCCPRPQELCCPYPRTEFEWPADAGDGKPQ